MATLQERFEKKFIPEPMSGCWLWTGVVWDQKFGYGKITIKSKAYRAHRVAWMLYRGEIPKATHVLHKCDNNFCVNPDHLYLGDQRQNNLDRDNRGKHVALHGSENGNSKLTEEDICEIRTRSESSIKLAPEFGIDAGTVRQIRRRETWKHVY